MAQTPTTTPLGLNQWNPTDEMRTAQFNTDNLIVDSELENKSDISASQITNRIYDGVDLTVAFASEIASAPYSGNPWAWIKARIQSTNFKGINVGDYIPFTADGNAIKAEVAGIDTYYEYGDNPVPHHIDFISRDCLPEPIQFNLVNNNNGTAVSPSPFLASNLYAKLNSLLMQVPNSTSNNTTLTTVDYRTTGIYDKLPAALQAVIVPKRLRQPSRYTAGSLLINDNNWTWVNVDKLWIPSEIEIYGTEQWGSRNGYSGGGFQQYPIFAANSKRIKVNSNGGARTHWWLMSAAGGYSTFFAFIEQDGSVSVNYADYINCRIPVCFRIA